MKLQSNETELQTINVIEDLTLAEAEAGHVKAGASDYLLEIEGIKGESTNDTRHSRR